MLNSLLDISKLDAGIVQPSVGPVDLAALLRKLDAEHQPIASQTGNRLRVRVANTVVLSDAGMLQRILSNLISNALRYTYGGRVLVGVRRRGDRVRVDVCDTGSGIPVDSLEDIFLEFHQLGNPERDRRRGLGLAIVKRLAGLLDHPIEVRSVHGRGSRFSITLPRGSGLRRAGEEQAPAARAGAGLQGRRVLVLDDEIAVLDAMRGLLESWGCEVVTTATPEDAEAQITAANRIPDLLVVDYRLRRHASGIETITRLRECAGTQVPALVITGDTAPDRLREAQRSGFPLLHKPVRPALLHSTLRRMLAPAQGGV
jgi:CheY-like chemotaxis protein/anti-sigma regulatory factor (Ser/Thr protein kinase)